jgi:hypothetical protein
MRRLLLDRAGEPDHLRGQAPLTGFQDPPVGVGEAGEVEGQQLRERTLGLIEAGLELAGRRAEGRHGGRLWRGHGAPRIAQQRLAGDGVGRHAPGLEKGLGLAGAQPVTQQRVREARLLRPRTLGEAVRRGGRELAGVDALGHGGGQAMAERQAAVDPAAPPAQQPGDLRGREVVLVDQRAHHARLVHGAERAAWGVGLEEPRLADDAGGVLDDDRHVGVAVAPPLGQALEPIEHREGAVRVGGHAQGHGRERTGGIGARAAHRRQRGGQLRDRQLTHGRGPRRAARAAAVDRAGSGRRSGPGP